MAAYHSLRELRKIAEGSGPGAKQAHFRLLWIERGRAHRTRGVCLPNRTLRQYGPIARQAYMEGYTLEHNPIGSGNPPRPLRAGSAEVRLG